MNILTQLKFLLDKLRQEYRRVLVLMLLLGTVNLAWVLLFTFISLDLAWKLPTYGCWLAWCGLVGLTAAGLYRLYRVWQTHPTDATLALILEKGIPGAQNRFVNAIQLAELNVTGKQVAEGVLEEAGDGWQEVDFWKIFPRAAFFTTVGMFLVSAILLLGLLVFQPAATANSLSRFLTPWAGTPPYSRTIITNVRPGNATINRGGTLEILANIAGDLPPEAIVEMRPGNGEVETQPLSLDDAPDNGNADAAFRQWWRGSLKNLFQESRYRVVAGDTTSPWYTVRISLPPALVGWSASVTPPAYTGKKPVKLDRNAKEFEVPAWSMVRLEANASSPLKDVRLTGARKGAEAKYKGDGANFNLSFPMPDSGPVTLILTGSNDLEATTPLPLTALSDSIPVVQIVDTPLRLKAQPTQKIPVNFEVRDDYGIKGVGIEGLPPELGGREVLYKDAAKPLRMIKDHLVLDLVPLSPKPGQVLRFRVFADDLAPLPRGKHRGYSTLLEVTVAEAEDSARDRKEAAARTKDGLEDLIKTQRENLGGTRRLTDSALAGNAIAPGPVTGLRATQESIRAKGVKLLAFKESLGDLANVLAALTEKEMVQAVSALDRAGLAGNKERGKPLGESVNYQNTILTALTGATGSLSSEVRHQEKTDLLEQLRGLVKRQRQNLGDTEKLQPLVKTSPPGSALRLAKFEDAIANDLTAFRNQSELLLMEPGDEGFAGKLREVCNFLNSKKVYEKMVLAAESLDNKEFPAAIQAQQEALAGLMKSLDILNSWTAENAKKNAKNAVAVIANIAEKLKDLEAKQAKITETSHAIATKNKGMDDNTRKQLAEMDAEQKKMADLVEQMANDLYQFPDMPVCNELNSKMREIYEDVQQAADSENAPAIEIAVQKEDSLLDAIRNTKERVEDVEMWLPDVPDNIAWNMESFDADEFPNMPLVPLPDELEDMVGELLDQAKDIEKKSQDSTGNNMMADGEMGWGVMDGPMPNFSAKGKSGNTKPNDNEMTGRSGAGREGQSNGELVENTVRGLEGTQTHARRTRDAFQNGDVKESKDSTLDARSTGGGKLGGQSESIGMFGKAPRRDLKMPDHANTPMQLRRETEALYNTARLLYLGGEGLGNAAREMRPLEKSQNLPSLAPLTRKVMRELEKSRVDIGAGTVVPLAAAGLEKSGGAAVTDFDLSQITDPAYRDMVRDYYRGLDQTEAKQ